MTLPTNHAFRLLLALAGGLLAPSVILADTGRPGAGSENEPAALQDEDRSKRNWRYGKYERRMWCPYWVPPRKSVPGVFHGADIPEDTWSDDPLEWGVVDGLVEIRSALPLEIGAVRVPYMYGVGDVSGSDGTTSSGRASVGSFDPRLSVRLGSLELDGGFSTFKVYRDPGESGGEGSVSAEGQHRPGNFFASATYSTASSSVPSLFRRYFGLTGAAHLSPVPHEYDNDNPEKRRAHALAMEVSPFQRARFGNFHTLQLMADLRYEFMGCHGPFIHLRAGLDWHDVSWALDVDAVVRMAVSVGARPWFSRDVRVFVEYALLAALDDDPGHRQIFNLGAQWTPRPDQTGRIRPTLGVSLGLPVGRFGGYAIGLDLTLAGR